MWYLISIVFLICVIIISIKAKLDFWEIIECGFYLIFIWLILTFALYGMASCFTIQTKTYEEKQYDIQGLENNIITSKDTNGAFILGFGYVNSDTKETIKYYYFKVDEIGKKLETLEITNNIDVYIRETNEIEPCYLYIYEIRKPNSFWKWFLGDFENENKIADVLVVPENTIKIEYNVEI